MKTVLILIGLFILAGGVVYAQGKMNKSDRGFEMSGKVKTWYENRIIWGDYIDHKEGVGVHNTEVIAFGDTWEFSTTTDDEGNFKVEVNPDSTFKLKASDGNVWAISDTITGVPLGTTKNDKIAVE